MSKLTLYPSNWLYNAGVIGLVRILEELNEPFTFSKNGTITLSLTEIDPEVIFRKWNDLSVKYKLKNQRVYGQKDAYYANQTESSIKRRISALCQSDASIRIKKNRKKYVCAFCTETMSAKESDASSLNQAFSNILFASETTFPNMYWCNTSRDYVCPRCEFIIMCHHLGFIPLSDGSEIFINAPSFRVMYYLNKFAQEVMGSVKSEEVRRERKILAMSVIEHAIKIRSILGGWVEMNIELMIRKGGQIDFHSLPYEVVRRLSDRRIAELLNRIGEFRILDKVLNQDFSGLLELGYRLLRIGLKAPQKRSKSENDYITKTLYLHKNRNNLVITVQNILKLYILVKEKNKMHMNTLTEVIELVKQIDRLKEQAEKLNEANPTLESFQEFYKLLQRVHRSFQESLDGAMQEQSQKEKEEFQKFYRQVVKSWASDLMETLRRIGSKLRKDQAIQEAFERQGYRILELVRAGKRNEVFYTILRIFASTNQHFPNQLLDAFDPKYSEDFFEVFLYSFLSGILGNKEKNNQETK